MVVREERMRSERNEALELQGTAEARMQEAQMRQIGLREERDRLQSDLTALREGLEAVRTWAEQEANEAAGDAASAEAVGALKTMVAALALTGAFNRVEGRLAALLTPASGSTKPIPLEPGES
jgi:hypothetical protein